MQIDMIKPTRGAAFWEIAAGPGSHVYALGGTKFVVSSSDAGASWTEEQLLTSKRTLKRVGLTAEGNLLVGTEGGQLFERVAGVWSETALKGLGEIASIVRTDEATVVGGKLLLRRPHGATEWLPVATKPKKLLRAQVIAAGGGLLGLFAQDILKSALWRSDDHGATWTALDVELEPQAEQVAAEGSRIVVSFVGGRALHSKDGGRSWQRVTLVNEAPYVRPLVAVVGDAIFTALQGTGSTGLFRSDDDGGRVDAGDRGLRAGAPGDRPRWQPVRRQLERGWAPAPRFNVKRSLGPSLRRQSFRSAATVVQVLPAPETRSLELRNHRRAASRQGQSSTLR